LPYRHARDDLITQVGSGFCRAPGAARGAKPAPLAGKRHQLLVSALNAAQAHKTVGQNAAFEKGLELVFDELRQARTGFRFDLGEEGLELFLHHLIESRFIRAPPLVGKGSRVASRRRLKRSAHDARLPTAISYITACNCAASHAGAQKDCQQFGIGQCSGPFCQPLFSQPVVLQPIRNRHDVSLTANL